MAAIQLQKAIFGGGCFWCMQPEFDLTKGVIETKVGYAGGNKANPTYDEVSSGDSGHIEVIEVTYDPGVVSYNKLLEIYFGNIDPTDGGGQFADRGSQYQPVIFYVDEVQKDLAKKFIAALEESKKFGNKIAVVTLPAPTFYEAEKYHQKYAEKNPDAYRRYKVGSGRASYIAKNPLKDLKLSAEKTISPEQSPQAEEKSLE
jgi:peptide methionine sulfoxide reductase msrA/msrB